MTKNTNSEKAAVAASGRTPALPRGSFTSIEGCPMEAASLARHGGEIPKFLPQDLRDGLARWRIVEF
jgi:hypothetical protein